MGTPEIVLLSSSDNAHSGNTAYIQYKWAKGKNGVMEPQVFTVYPVAAK